MNIWNNAVITTKGLALEAKLISGTTLQLTRAQTGAGRVAVSQLQAQTAVTTPKQTLTFNTISYPEEGTAAVPCSLTNDSLTTGYTATQIGIFAQDPDEGEILYFIAQADTGTGTDIPSATEMPGFTAEWTFYFAYGLADSVSVTVNPANTVSKAEAQTLITNSLNTSLAPINSTLSQHTTAIEAATTTANAALPKAGGNMTGNIGYSSGTKTGDMIRFIPGDKNGSGIAIGDGGAVVIGGGESSSIYEGTLTSGSAENLILANDTTIDFYTNAQSGADSAQHIVFEKDGSITAPGGFNGYQKKITSGTAAPSGGSNGDIYIQY